ncbi:hypothetical protein GQ457_07G003860 [Hibiscus cannabinus]
MRCLCSVFDVKKQGKPIWEVRTRNWKLWEGHEYARNVGFERITSYASTRPIVIDQFYCPHNHCKDQVSYLTTFYHPYTEPS